MNGWKYEWVAELPQHVYETLLAMLNEEHEKQDRD